MTALPFSFYQREDVVQIAKDLLGKVIVSVVDGNYTSGIITETEAYKGAEDKASHAYQNKRTARTEIMFGPGGFSYVYLCYGIHHLFNVVTNIQNIPHAVLIRNTVPLHGVDSMLKRRNRDDTENLLTGPGTLTQALGIDKEHNTISLQSENLRIEDHNIHPEEIIESPRIGVDYAGKDALLLYRFLSRNK